MTNEVFSWNARQQQPGPGRRQAARTSSTRSRPGAPRRAPTRTVADDMFFVPALRGPGGGRSPPSTCCTTGSSRSTPRTPTRPRSSCCTTRRNFAAATYASKLYDFCACAELHAQPGRAGWPATRSAPSRPDKLALLNDATKWSTNIGHPGPANTAEGEVFNTFVIPNMFARAARGEQSAQQAVADGRERRSSRSSTSGAAQGLVGRARACNGGRRGPEPGQGVRRRAGSRAVDGIDLATEEGEYLVLLGPSGCGKTTLLRTIAGLEQPTVGRRAHRRPRRHRAAAAGPPGRDGVPELRALPAQDRATANIVFPLRAARMAPRTSATARRAGRPSCSASSTCSTASRASSPAASGSGWRWPGRWSASRRCSCSTSRCPTWTPSCGRSARDELKRFQEEIGTTTIYVTHDQVEAMGLGDRIAVLSRGRGPPGRTAGRGVRRPGRHVRRHVHRLAADEPRAARRRAGRLPARAPAARRGGRRRPTRCRSSCRRPGRVPLRRPARLRHGAAASASRPASWPGCRPRSTTPVAAGRGARRSRSPGDRLRFFDADTGRRTDRYGCDATCDGPGGAATTAPAGPRGASPTARARWPGSS